MAITPGTGQGTGLGTAATTYTMTMPTASAGDILIAIFSVRGGSNTTVTAPGGWTLITVVHTGAGTAEISTYAYWHEHSGSEPASYDWTFSSAQRASGGITPYSGVNTTTPVDVYGSQTNASSTSIVAPSVDATVTDGYLVVGAGTAVGTSTMNQPGGYTEFWDIQVSACTTESCGKALTASGATGTTTVTAGSAAKNNGITIVLKPASGGITGESSTTLEAVGGTGAGAVSVTGASSGTLADVASAASGAVAITGESNVVLESVAGTAAGAVSIAGASVATLDNLMATATGVVGVTGESSSSLDDIASAGAGAVAVAGISTTALGDVAGTGAGVVAIVGASAGSLDGVTSVATGAVAIVGASAVTLAGVTGVATGIAVALASVPLTLRARSFNYALPGRDAALTLRARSFNWTLEDA